MTSIAFDQIRTDGVLLSNNIPSEGYIYTDAQDIYEKRDLWDKIVDVATSFFHMIAIFFTETIPNFFNYIFSPHKSYCIPSGENNDWKENSSGLFVFLTGLKGHPVWAAPYLAQIEKERPNIEVRLPHIPHEGDCSLDEATQPVLDMVKDYIQKN
jgi:hypothetical protein